MVYEQIFFSGNKDPYDFAIHAAAMGFAGIEYVNQFYFDQLKNGTISSKKVGSLAKTLNSRAKDNNISNVLIMVDEEGNLADSSSTVIKRSIEQHKKWVELAAELSCHSIRVNLAGEKDPERWINKSVEGLTGLCEFSKTMGINIIVENHGGLSSNGSLLAQVMKKPIWTIVERFRILGIFALQTLGGVTQVAKNGMTCTKGFQN